MRWEQSERSAEIISDRRTIKCDKTMREREVEVQSVRIEQRKDVKFLEIRE